MAFFDDSDLPKAEPKATAQPARKGLLVPILLGVLILCVAALVAVLALPLLRSGDSSPADRPQVSASDLDPKLLTTPTGRRLDVVEFGGFLFEITRIAYSNHTPSRTVTITVPGDPPAMGIFRTGESFAGGKIRIVDISPSAVALECGGEQQVFPIYGSDPAEIWSRDSGTHMIPPRETGAVPDLPVGAQRPPMHPIPEDDDVDREGPGIKSIDDLPWVEEVAMSRADYLDLVRELPDRFEASFVFGVAIEDETRSPYGLEIKNLMADSFFYSRGMQVGDVILFVNGHAIKRIADLDLVARGNHFRKPGQEEIVIEVERKTRRLNPETNDPEDVFERITFIYHPGSTG